MTEANPYFPDGLIEETNREVIEIAPAFATAQNMLFSVINIQREQLSMGHMQQLTAIVAMAETVRQLNACAGRPRNDQGVTQAINEALDLLRQAVAP